MIGRHVRDDLVRYAERQLDAAARARVEAHLAVCAECWAAAGETVRLVDALQAMPVALRGLPWRSGRQWPGLWGLVQLRAARSTPRTPRLRLCLSLATAAFSLMALLPVGLASQPGSVTAGVVETPRQEVLTPRVADGSDPDGRLAAEATSAAGDLGLAVGPVPVPTPMPGPAS